MGCTSEDAKKGWNSRRTNSPALAPTRHRDSDPTYEQFKKDSWEKFVAENGRLMVGK